MIHFCISLRLSLVESWNVCRCNFTPYNPCLWQSSRGQKSIKALQSAIFIKFVQFKAPIIEDNWYYGGGYGYPKLIDPSADGVILVQTLEELQSAVQTPNTTVYLEDNVAIDITDASLCIASGVTLAGGRGSNASGHSPGGIVFRSDISERKRINVCGDDVRITGALFNHLPMQDIAALISWS